MSDGGWDRRTFLRNAGLTGAGAALLAGLPRPAAAADEDLAPFEHGVASGDPLADRVVIWTRVTPPGSGPVQVQWVVARDVALTQGVRSGAVTAQPERDWTVKVDVDGLAPATGYFYGFRALGAQSLTGRTRTAPARGSGATSARFAMVSCSNYPVGLFNSYAAIAERDDVDVVLHLGDYIYENPAGSDGSFRPVEPPGETVVLTDYRTRYALYRRDPDLRRLHQLFPFVTVWDDHESANDSWEDGADNHQDDEGVWAERKAQAQQAYDEWLPIRSVAPDVIFRSLPWGDLLDLVLLDTRLFGRDQQVGMQAATLPESELDDPSRELLGPEQRAFLFEALDASAERWTLVGQQVMLMQWNAGGLPTGVGGFDQPDLLPTRDGGNALNPDAWDGYTAERRRVLGYLRDNGLDDVVVLTGDIHTHWAADLVVDPYDPTQYVPPTGDGSLAVEFVCASVTSSNFAEFGPAGVLAAEEATKADNPHIKYVDLDAHGWVTLDVRPERVQADFHELETILEPSTANDVVASFEVRRGENRLRQVGAPLADVAPGLPAPPALPVVGSPVPGSPSSPSPSPSPTTTDAGGAGGGTGAGRGGTSGSGDAVTTTGASSSSSASSGGQVLAATGGPASVGVLGLAAAATGWLLRRRTSDALESSDHDPSHR